MAKPAVIIVDMLNDNAGSGALFGINNKGSKVIPKLQRLLAEARSRGIPVVFANDSFMPNDFIFKGKLRPRCIRGTKGAAVIDDLQPKGSDIVLDKRRFSAFFKTDLDITLRDLGVDTIAVGGIVTEVCVLTTALDGIANGFYAILLDDCCASHSEENHQAVLNIYSRAVPMLTVMTLDQFLSQA